MRSSWLGDARVDLAESRILDGAAAAFAELGVGAVTMADVARHAGCSRGTVYRYFGNREALHLAYVRRGAREIAGLVRTRTASIADPQARIVAMVLEAVRAVRARPDMAAWFAADQSGATARLSRRPELLDSLAGGFDAPIGGHAADPADRRLALRWVVRVIVSLLSNPPEDPREERALVARFVAPGLVAAPRA